MKSRAERRALRFGSMSEIFQEAQRLDAAPARRATGGWSDGQIVEHLTRLIDLSFDGFPVTLPWPLRVAGRLLRPWILRGPLRPGIRLRGRLSFLCPDDAVSWPQALEHMQRTIGRLQTERMTAVSPLLGRLTHEQWQQFHCRHAELHLSFIHPEA